MLALITLILGLSFMCLEGVYITYLWEWFVVPFGLPSIGWAHGVGIGLLVSMLTLRAKNEHDPRTDEQKQFDSFVAVFSAAFASTLLFFFGFVFSFGV